MLSDAHGNRARQSQSTQAAPAARGRRTAFDISCLLSLLLPVLTLSGCWLPLQLPCLCSLPEVGLCILEDAAMHLRAAATSDTFCTCSCTPRSQGEILTSVLIRPAVCLLTHPVSGQGLDCSLSTAHPYVCLHSSVAVSSRSIRGLLCGLVALPTFPVVFIKQLRLQGLCHHTRNIPDLEHEGK